ncbi:Helix-turn-helix domain-containing protein [Paenibacillus sp. yr247]|nr:Helix-turn-helix domain-containing protein [Paenibacillus sp. yr247]
MHKAFKFRLYPTKEQQTLINKTIGCVRFVFNHFLARRQDAYEQEKRSLGYNACSAELTVLKREKEWLQKKVSKVNLPNIRLTRDEKRATLLKASLHNGGNVSAYIRELILNDNREPKPMATCSCGSHSLHITHTDEERMINLGEGERVVRLTVECGKVLGDLRLSAQIKSFLDGKFLQTRDFSRELENLG